MSFEQIDQAEIVSISEATYKDYQKGKIIEGEDFLAQRSQLQQLITGDIGSRTNLSRVRHLGIDVEIRASRPRYNHINRLDFDGLLKFTLDKMKFYGRVGGFTGIKTTEINFIPRHRHEAEYYRAGLVELEDISAMLLDISLLSTGIGRVASLYMGLVTFVDRLPEGICSYDEAHILKLDRTRLELAATINQSAFNCEQTIRQGLRRAYQAGLPGLGKRR